MPAANELYDEAIALKEQDKSEEAIVKLNETLAEDPEYALAYSALAVICQKLEKHAEAVEYATKVCELEPNDPFSYTALSVICQRAYAGTLDQGFIKKAEDAMAQSHTLRE